MLLPKKYSQNKDFSRWVVNRPLVNRPLVKPVKKVVVNRPDTKESITKDIREKVLKAENFFTDKNIQAKSVIALSKVYGEKETIRKMKEFINYWTEETDEGVKRWQTKDIFNITHRLNSWFSKPIKDFKSKRENQEIDREWD